MLEISNKDDGEFSKYKLLSLMVMTKSIEFKSLLHQIHFEIHEGTNEIRKISNAYNKSNLSLVEAHLAH